MQREGDNPSSKDGKTVVSEETKKEVSKVLLREIRVNSESLLSEVISVRSELCLTFSNDRENIVMAFSDLLFSARDLNEKIKRYERRG